MPDNDALIFMPSLCEQRTNFKEHTSEQIFEIGRMELKAKVITTHYGDIFLLDVDGNDVYLRSSEQDSSLSPVRNATSQGNLGSFSGQFREGLRRLKTRLAKRFLITDEWSICLAYFEQLKLALQ